ncbi:TetR/AcrR family transcriptional regulator [Sphingobium sp. EM0848]|uniref:TetR/AcrR family transcriptional regulator n=1 Tax=Sphingobium sp. EM0848 TaxID=2743473 RepID=UPI00159C560F|nr:TetR/AcrR family transcriptional regulator [Sphingobium sp. EM0848]
MDLLNETSGAAKPVNPTAQKIVRGARKCFKQYGLQKTTIEDIAVAAGVSRPTVYKHFTSKQEIVDYISLSEMAKVHDEFRTRMARHDSFAETVTEAILISVQVAHENFYVRRFVQELEMSSRSQNTSSPFQVGARARWASLLAKAKQSGELATDVSTDQVVSWLSLTQMMLLGTYDQLGVNEEQARHFIRRFIVEPLLAGRGQPAG